MSVIKPDLSGLADLLVTPVSKQGIFVAGGKIWTLPLFASVIWMHSGLWAHGGVCVCVGVGGHMSRQVGMCLLVMGSAHAWTWAQYAQR
jgi:hypothetical protein